MGGCIGINRTTDTETVNGSSTNVSRPASGKIFGIYWIKTVMVIS